MTMTLDTLTAFFGWMAVLNIAYLLFATLMLVAFKGWVGGIHRRLFGLSEEDTNRAYFDWLGNYKIFTVVLSIMPYLALRII